MYPQIRPLAICSEPLKFVCGVAKTLTFQGYDISIFRNMTSNPRYAYGYKIFDENHEVIKSCLACNRDSIARAVILN